MRTLTIIDLAPVVKMGLAFYEAAPGMVAQEFHLEMRLEKALLNN